MADGFTTICPTCHGKPPVSAQQPHPNREGALAVVLTPEPCRTCDGNGDLGGAVVPI
ncbi:hypothetical protein ACFVBP_10635 [Nocardioides sp. NPDC057764]|uniref:hypothetical protein n=1 Tax=Nocardioides sp. NPDC057764 TaxID=3346243 RepID=UPI0036702D81